jgi:tetratricopeptide (TPR) repeat protein
MGDLARNTFHPEEAARHYRRARDTWRSVPRPESDPHPLLGLEAVPAMPDGEVRARAVVDEAAQVYGAIGDAAGSGDVQMVLGELELAVGNASAAAAAFRGAREQYGGADLPVLAATAALWQARTEMDRGLNIAADATLEVAEALFAAVGEDQGVGRVLFAQGSLARQLGHMESAASFYREAAAQLASDASAANALVRLGEVEAWRGDTEAAWEAFQGAGRLAARSGAVRLGLGLMALGEGDPGTAQEHLAAAVDRFAASGDAVQHGRALLGLAEVAALLDPGSAPALYEWAGTLFAAGVSPFGELLAATREAAFAYDSGDATRSVELTKRARQLRRKMRRPVAEANRFLGLPAVEQIEVGEEDLGHHFGPDILAQEALAATRAANLAQHPNHNREARDLVVATDAALLALGFEV